MGKFVAQIAFSERIQKEQEFFDKDFLMSYSGLNKLVFSPSSFYKHYVLGQKEDVIDKIKEEFASKSLISETCTVLAVWGVSRNSCSFVS